MPNGTFWPGKYWNPMPHVNIAVKIPILQCLTVVLWKSVSISKVSNCLVSFKLTWQSQASQTIMTVWSCLDSLKHSWTILTVSHCWQAQTVLIISSYLTVSSWLKNFKLSWKSQTFKLPSTHVWLPFILPMNWTLFSTGKALQTFLCGTCGT